MVMSQVERLMARRQIKALIDSDPIDIVLYRSERTKTAAGGWVTQPPAALPPQRVTLIPFKRRMTDFLINTELGDVIDLPYVLVGLHTLNVMKKDFFWHDGEKYQVETLDLKREVRIAAHVDYFGGASHA